MKHNATFLAFFALLISAGCTANQQPMIMSWKPVGNTTMPVEQARFECRFEVAKDPRTIDRLHAMSGAPLAGHNGAVMFNAYGAQLFELCMGARGYRPAGMVPQQAP